MLRIKSTANARFVIMFIKICFCFSFTLTFVFFLMKTHTGLVHLSFSVFRNFLGLYTTSVNYNSIINDYVFPKLNARANIHTTRFYPLKSIRAYYSKIFYMLSRSVFSNHSLRSDIDIIYARNEYFVIFNISSAYKNTKKEKERFCS